MDAMGFHLFTFYLPVVIGIFGRVNTMPLGKACLLVGRLVFFSKSQTGFWPAGALAKVESGFGTELESSPCEVISWGWGWEVCILKSNLFCVFGYSCTNCLL